MLSPRKPLIAFVHIPKASGSSVNEALGRWGKGYGHAEALLDDPQALRKVARRSDWISGHIPIDRFQAALEGLDRPVRYFACVREPRAQVTSHFNWLIEIYHRGPEFFATHSARVQQISADLRGSDLSDPSVIAALILKYKTLLLNMQSRYILGKALLKWPNRFPEAAARFEWIGTHDNIDALLGRMVPGLRAGAPQNSSPYHVDPGLFRTKEVKEVLLYRNKSDRLVYRHVCAHFDPQGSGQATPT